MLDQNANIQLQMSKQFSITIDQSTYSDGSYVWGNPRLDGFYYVDDTGETIFSGPLFTTREPPRTIDDSIFGFSPGLVCSPVLTLLLALMLLIS
ncbi:Meprin A subunit beta [Dissostichus eleginoides]|uniref:Meprin A subunit beta n=1 Tax=Dissostichus eleginoides TaxID=100907 RepID=A0AAD9CV90_DISEL|nr:Meprin A subunit beta [Dissostichus eleginoides]